MAPIEGPGWREVARPRSDLRRGITREFALFLQPHVFLAVLALIFVPSLYVLIYVSSVWDPYGNFSKLPVALANQDVPVQRRGREINLGARMVETLEHGRPFAVAHYATPEAAKADVRSGKVFFALLIPPDFSERAVTATQPAQLTLYLSEGSNYTASLVGKRFGAELAHTVNENLNRERWAALVGDESVPVAAAPTLRQGLVALQEGGRQVFAGATELHRGSARVEEGVTRSAQGAEKLAEGTVELATGSTRLTGGLEQARGAVTHIRGKLPEDQKLEELAAGSKTLALGAADLAAGLAQLKEGATRLEAGAVQFHAGVIRVPVFGGRLAAGAEQLHSGIAALDGGVDRTNEGAGRLNRGMQQLDSRLQLLSAGLIELNAGLRTLNERLPVAGQLELFDQSMIRLRDGNQAMAAGLRELQQGAAQLRDGAGDLERGTGQLASGLNEAVTNFETAFGGARALQLAASVEIVTEVVAPVPQNGPAFAPYFAALSLWIGAVMMSFVFYLRRLPADMQAASRPVRWLAKATPLLALGILQATVVVGVLKFGLRVPLAQAGAVWAVAALGSVAFVSVVLGLITFLGDAGRLVAVVLLIFQLSASGGIYPIELSPGFYQAAHSWLPFTYLVHAFRATMFLAFEGRWQTDAVVLVCVTVGAVLAGLCLARWKYVAPENYGAAVEF